MMVGDPEVAVSDGQTLGQQPDPEGGGHRFGPPVDPDDAVQGGSLTQGSPEANARSPGASPPWNTTVA